MKHSETRQRYGLLPGSPNPSISFHVRPRTNLPTFSRPLEQQRSAYGTRLVIQMFTVKERGSNRGRHGNVAPPASPCKRRQSRHHFQTLQRTGCMPTGCPQDKQYDRAGIPSHKFRGCITPTSSPAAGPRAPNQPRLKQLLGSTTPHHPKERPRNRFFVLRPLHLACLGRVSLQKRLRIWFTL